MNSLPDNRLHRATNSILRNNSNSRALSSVSSIVPSANSINFPRSARGLGSSLLFGTIFVSAAIFAFGLYGAIAIFTLPETGMAEPLERANLRMSSDYKFGFTQAAYSMQRDAEERSRQRSRAYAAKKLFPDSGMTLRGYNAFGPSDQESNEVAAKNNQPIAGYASRVSKKTLTAKENSEHDRLSRIAERAKYGFSGLERDEAETSSWSKQLSKAIGIDADGMEELKGNVKELPKASGNTANSRSSGSAFAATRKRLALAIGSKNNSPAAYEAATGLDHPAETPIEMAAVMAHDIVLVATDVLGAVYHNFIEPSAAYADGERDLDSILSPQATTQHSFERDELVHF